MLQLQIWFYLLQTRAREEKGATAVEYGLLVGLIAVAIIATLVLLGPKLDALFSNVNTKLPTPTS